MFCFLTAVLATNQLTKLEFNVELNEAFTKTLLCNRLNKYTKIYGYYLLSSLFSFLHLTLTTAMGTVDMKHQKVTVTNVELSLGS